LISDSLFQRRSKREKRGQSLVEFTLSLPIILLIVAGTLEVGNLLVIYNRIQNTAREGARFGAAGGTDGSVAQVAQHALQGSAVIEPEYLTIWVVRPVIDTQAGDWYWEGDPSRTTWGTETEEVCVYGDECASMATSGLSPQKVLEDIQSVGAEDPRAPLDGTRFSIVAVRYHAQTVLNLPFYQLTGSPEGRVTIQAHTVMRQEVAQTGVVSRASGCTDAYPIALNSSYLTGAIEGSIFADVPFNDEYAGQTDGFQFLAWRVDQLDAAALAASLDYPGNSDTYEEYNSDPLDTQLHRLDWVAKSSGTVSDVQSKLDTFISTGRTLRIVVYDGAVSPVYMGTPTPLWQYQASDFAIVRILSYDAGANQISFEFLRMDEGCGYDL
jgi:hypothetical protein